MTAKKVIFPLSLFLLVLIWVLVSNLNIIDTLFLPTPGEMIEAFQKLFSSPDYYIDIAVSTRRVFFAFFLSFIIAIPVALLVVQSTFFKHLLEPYIDFIRYLPVPALIPLSILFFGLGEGSKIALLFMGTFFQLVLLVIDSFYRIPGSYVDLAKSLGFSKTRVLIMKLRSISPELYDNSRITLGWCWTYLVIAEIVAAQSGLGHVIKEAQRFSDTSKVFIAIFTLGVIGLLIDQCLKRLKPYLFPYLKI